LQLQILEEFTRSGVPVTLVECSGSLTGPDGTRLRDQLLVVLRHGPRHLLLDLAQVTDFDDVAAAILIDTHRRAPAAGCSFGLVAPAEDVLTRLQLTGLPPVPGLAHHARTGLERPGTPDRRAAGDVSPVRSEGTTWRLGTER